MISFGRLGSCSMTLYLQGRVYIAEQEYVAGLVALRDLWIKLEEYIEN
jgi:hypothetical protein